MAGRNRVRSDYTLASFLRLVESLAESAQVKSAVEDVLEHMGPSYRGGKVLLELIRFAIRQAESGDDLESAARLDDALGYATGRVLGPELEDKYQLFAGAPDRTRGMVELMVSNVHLTVAGILEDFLERHPDAGLAEVRNHFRRLSKASIQVVEDREAGNYRVHRLDEHSQIRLAEVLTRRTVYEPLTSSATAATELPPESETILSRADAESLLAVMQVRLRRRRLAEIRRVVEHPYSSEPRIQEAFAGAWWVFGGEYAGQSSRRRLTPGLELDIPLLRADGVLHVVELKRANVKVVEPHRTSTIPTVEVHKGVAQIQNYLKLLDENRATVLDHGVDPRRATAVLVIGHPVHQPGYSEAQVKGTTTRRPAGTPRNGRQEVRVRRRRGTERRQLSPGRGRRAARRP